MFALTIIENKPTTTTRIAAVSSGCDSLFIRQKQFLAFGLLHSRDCFLMLLVMLLNVNFGAHSFGAQALADLSKLCEIGFCNKWDYEKTLKSNLFFTHPLGMYTRMSLLFPQSRMKQSDLFMDEASRGTCLVIKGKQISIIHFF